jgi:hypothetical protein
MTTSLPRPSLGRLVHILALAYGGVALLQWFHATALGGVAEPGLTGVTHWLRDSTLALPFVALAVFLGSRSARPVAFESHNSAIAILFATIMGVGSLVHQASPDLMGGHATHSSATMPGVQQFVLIVLLAWAYATIAGRALHAADGRVEALLAHLRTPSRLVSTLGVGAAVLALVPALFVTDSHAAVAQTSFPDHVIHPHGTLTLLARKLADGTLAYVAPEYGELGMRPTIEMTEGETLDITLVNTLDEDVSLHVHGVLYSPDSDGTRHNNSFVRPGEQRVYQWRAARGTAGYWHYHDHVMGDNEGTKGIASGLYGGLVVRRPGDVTPDRTFVLVMHNYSINGRIYPDTPHPVAYQGEVVEFLVIGYMDLVHTFHLHGHRWLTMTRAKDPDSSSLANAYMDRVDNHVLAPGDSFGFRVIAGDGVGPGEWMYHCHVQNHSAGMMGYFEVLPAPPQAGPR